MRTLGSTAAISSVFATGRIRKVYTHTESEENQHIALLVKKLVDIYFHPNICGMHLQARTHTKINMHTDR